MSLLSIDRVGSAVILRLNDPDRRNVLSRDLCTELSAAVLAIKTDAAARSLVIAGEGSAFCAGADLADLLAAAGGKTRAVNAVYQAFMDVAECGLPTVAAVGGPAIGAGFNLALACDVRVANPSARFETRFLKIGLHPGGGHGWMLLRAVGWSEATRLVLSGQPVDADEALRIGLVQRIVPAEDLVDTAISVFASASQASRDLVTRTKASLRLAATSSHADAFSHETAEQLWSLGEPAFAELTEKLKANLSGRAQ